MFEANQPVGWCGRTLAIHVYQEVHLADLLAGILQALGTYAILAFQYWNRKRAEMVSLFCGHVHAHPRVVYCVFVCFLV